MEIKEHQNVDCLDNSTANSQIIFVSFALQYFQEHPKGKT